MSIFVNRDGSTEAWDGDNYVPLGSMRVPERKPAPEPIEVMDGPPVLYMEIEEYPAFTIDEFIGIATDQRKQRRRKRRFRELLQSAAEIAAERGSGAES